MSANLQVFVVNLSIIWNFLRFNRTLMNKRGLAMGQEFKGKGVHVGLGPMMLVVLFQRRGKD